MKRILFEPAAPSADGGAPAPAPAPASAAPVATSADGGLASNKIITMPVDQAKAGIPGEQNRGADDYMGLAADANLDDGEVFDGLTSPTLGLVKPAAPAAPIAQPAAAPVTAPVIKPADVVAATIPAAAIPAATVPPALPPHADDKGRDYSLFDQADVPALRAMPNAAFNHFKNRLPAFQKQVTEANNKYKSLLENNGIPESYLEHPDAVQLTAPYRQGVAKFERASNEEQVFQSVLEGLNSNQQVVKMPKMYDAQGNLVTTDVVVTVQNKAQLIADVQQKLAKLGVSKETIANQVQQLQQTHQEKFKQTAQIVAMKEDEYFPMFKQGSEHWSPQLQTMHKEFVATLPPALRTSPLASPLGKSYLLITALNNRTKALEEQIRVLTGGKAPAAAAIPASQEQQLSGVTTQAVASSAGGAEEMYDPNEWKK
jgi:hypothetical protein